MHMMQYESWWLAIRDWIDRGRLTRWTPSPSPPHPQQLAALTESPLLANSSMAAAKAYVSVCLALINNDGLAAPFLLA